MFWVFWGFGGGYIHTVLYRVCSWDEQELYHTENFKKCKFQGPTPCIDKAMVFFPVVMYRCESLTIKKAEYQSCFQTMVLEKISESPLNNTEIKPVNPKGNQSWIFIGRTDAEAEVPILWLPDEKSRLIGKDPDAGKDWGQEEKGAVEDEMVR